MFRNEFALAKAELATSADRAKAGVASLIGAVCTLLAGSLTLVAAIVLALAEAMKPWVAALIVGVAITAVGALLLYNARKKLVPPHIELDRTKAAVRNDVEVLARRTPDESHVGTTGREPDRTAGAPADQIRADMDRTLDALERKLSPSQLLDRSLDYLRAHSGDMSRARSAKLSGATRYRSPWQRPASAGSSLPRCARAATSTIRSATSRRTRSRASGAAGSTTGSQPRAANSLVA